MPSGRLGISPERPSNSDVAPWTVVEHRLCRLPLAEEMGGWGLGLVEFLQVLERLAGDGAGPGRDHR